MRCEKRFAMDATATAHMATHRFNRSARLTAFLRYIVEQALSGDAATLKEQVLAIELYSLNGDFDAALDPIVRVDARRLRDKLREYYTQWPNQPIIISLPKGTYAPVEVSRCLPTGTTASA